MIKTGQAVTVEFTTANPLSLAAQNATTTPTGTLYVNGTANAAVVTVTNITVGVYKAAVTLPALGAGDLVGLRISAVCGGVAGEAIVWQETADTARVSEVHARLGSPAGASLAADVATRSTFAAGGGVIATNMVAAPDNAGITTLLGRPAPATPANITTAQGVITDAIAAKAVTPVTDLTATNSKIDAAKTSADLANRVAPDNAGIATLKALVENAGGHDRFSALALEAAPTGSGGGGTAYDDTALIAAVADVKASADAAARPGATMVPSVVTPAAPSAIEIDARLTAQHGAGIWGGAGGAGSIEKTYTLTDGINPIADANVWITTDSGGSNVIASGMTDQYGEVSFMLDAGTVYVWRAKTGFVFVNPDAEVV